jgi:hypothetical protein
MYMMFCVVSEKKTVTKKTRGKIVYLQIHIYI